MSLLHRKVGILPATKENMRTYGKTLFEKIGYCMVEVWDTDTAGLKELIGYAIVDPDGLESGFFSSYDDAIAEFKRVTDDNEPSVGYEP